MLRKHRRGYSSQGLKIGPLIDAGLLESLQELFPAENAQPLEGFNELKCDGPVGGLVSNHLIVIFELQCNILGDVIAVAINMLGIYEPRRYHAPCIRKQRRCISYALRRYLVVGRFLSLHPTPVN